jgi:hypothetical protein
MFVNSTNQVGVTQRVVATLVACAVVLVSYGAYNTAQAANLTSVSNTLTDSAPSVLSGHSFAFTVPAVIDGGTAIAPGDTTTITFDALFTGVTDVVDGDVTVTVDGVDASAAATVDGASATTVTVTGITVAAGEAVVVAIADTRITNPAKVLADGIGDSYEFTISNTNDSGKTRVAIIDTVEVTAIVETTFDFVISPIDVGVDVNGETTTGSSSTTTIPFGVLTADTDYVIGQQLNVTTNAANGFVVTVEQDGNLESSTGADIDGFTNGTYVDTPEAWSNPTGTLVSGENGWGHWGLTSEDSDLNGDEFGSQLFVAASTTPREIFSHTGVTDGTTVDVGETEVAYKIRITALQEAGDDYNTTLTYIATPTF